MLEKQLFELNKYQNKLECIINEILTIKESKSSLNLQADSIHSKLFM